LNAVPETLPLKQLTRLENFGHSLNRVAYVYRPEDTSQLEQLFELARRQDFTIALRGSGRSYGDAALNAGQIVLDLRGLTRVLDWNPDSGLIRVEPGVTIEQLWRHVLPYGWWPPVVPGTMFPTLGGCLAANVHGKNNWQAGPLGEHVVEFEALLPNGQRVTCAPKQNEELFYAIISGMGLLGVFTSITLQMKKIYSGDMTITAWTEPNLAGMLTSVDAHKESDYVVGWVDAAAGGRSAGRGQIHSARYLKEGEDANPAATLRVEHQDLPARLLGVVPKSALPPLMAPFVNNFGAGLVNAAKYFADRTLGHQKTYRQSLVAFNFLFDYIPNWERIYGRGGLIQHQSFLPKEQAGAAYAELLALCKRRGLPSYLVVLKRHRPDRFLLTNSVDGYSLAMDFRVTRANAARLIALAADLDEIVLSAGGRFYFAKDSTLDAARVRRYLGEGTIAQLRKLKEQVDPQQLLQHDLYRRCLAA
jgi:FAD/FMN-containing dehydrogenase